MQTNVIAVTTPEAKHVLNILTYEVIQKQICHSVIRQGYGQYHMQHKHSFTHLNLQHCHSLSASN